MKDVYTFIMNALPWIAMGLIIAIYGTYQAKKDKAKNKNNQ